jgi:hypothetical protein
MGVDDRRSRYEGAIDVVDFGGLDPVALHHAAPNNPPEAAAALA